jgi:hypothetical protein
MFCAPRLIVDGSEGVVSRFHVLRQDLFSAVPRVSGPIFMFCAPGLIVDGTEGVGSCFHVLRAWIHFRQSRGRRVPFSCFALSDSFLAVLRASSPVFMFCTPGLISFSTVLRASCPVFMFCTPGLIFDGTEGVGSRFPVLCSRTRFRRYRGRWVPFSCFAPPESFSAVPRALAPVLMLCAPGVVFGDAECVRSRFHIFPARTRFRRYRGRRLPF